MPTYTYESRLGNRVERHYPVTKYPQSIKVDGVRMDLVITAPAFVVENVAHLSGALPGRKRVIRNKHDIRNIEAANPGVKFNPEAFQRDTDVPLPK